MDEWKERCAGEFVVFPADPILDPFFALLCLCLRLLGVLFPILYAASYLGKVTLLVYVNEQF